MKSIIILIGLIYATSATIPNAYIQDITKAKVTGATVYTSYAELQIEIPLKVTSGRTEVLLTNLPANSMYDGTFRVSAQSSQVTSFALGNRMIPSGTVNNTRLSEYEDELKRVENDYSVTRTLIENLTERNSVLKSLMQPRGDKMPSVEEMDAIVELIATKGAAIAKELAELKIKEEKLKQSKEALVEKIKEEKNKGRDVEDYVVSIILNNNSHFNNPEVEAAPRDEVVTIKYLVNSASWSPSYEIYYNPEDGTAQLQYYAQILQSTGFDFDNVPITLATARFLDVGKIPELATVQIEIAPVGFVSSQNVQESYMKSSRVNYNKVSNSYIGRPAAQKMAWTANDQSMAFEGADFGVMHEEMTAAIVEDKFVAATFQLGQGLYVPSNQQVPSKVLIASIPLKLNVRHYAVPKLSDHAYLRGFTINPSKLVLLRGPLSVYINNSYVTKTVLAKDVQPEAKFSVLLGVDEGIEIKYKPESKFKETEGFIKSYTVQHAYLTISATNNKQEDVTIWIYDQLPKSTDEKIVVSLIQPIPEKATKINATDDLAINDETAAFTINSVTQTVRWIETIKPGQTKQMPFHFKVTYPENERIIVQDNNK